MTTQLEERLARLSPEQRTLYEMRLRKLAEEKTRQRDPVIPKREGEGPWPASMDQTALWFFHQMDPETTAYNLGVGQIVRGPLDLSVLERALREMVRRHEILRTTFRSIDNKLYQVVDPEPRAELPLLDFTGFPERERMPLVQAVVPNLVRQPFDLERGPLIRLPLIRVDEREHVMLASMHHAVTDWWSYKLFFREIMVIHLAFQRGRPSPLAELPVQFADFSVYRNDWLASAAFLEQLAYWMNQLDGAPLVLEIPADRPRPPVQSFRGERAYFRGLSPRLLEGIRAMNRRLNATSLMTTLAGTFAFLNRYTGVDDLLIGTSTAGRELKSIENMIGYILNVLVLRCRVHQNITFAEVAAQTKETVLGAFSHKELPFRYLVEKLHPERELSRMPIYQVDFNHVASEGPVFHDHHGVDHGMQLPGLSIDKIDLNRGVSDVDLQIDFDERIDDIFLCIEYNTDIFERATVDHMAELLLRFMENLVWSPDKPVAQVGWLSERERRDLLVAWNGDPLDYPRELTIHAGVEAWSGRAPHAAALVEPGRRVTYGALNVQANRIANFLAGQGLTPGQAVGLCLRPGPDWVAAMLGILKAGAAYVPLDPEYPRERLAYMFADTAMSALVTRSDMIDLLPAHELNFINTLVLDEDTELLTLAGDENPGTPVTALDLAYVIYTSGTTGRPKGVQVSHRNVNRLAHDSRYLAAAAGDGIGQASNTSFDAHVFEVWTALQHGCRLCFVDKDSFLDSSELDSLIRRVRIDILFMTTALFNQFARDIPTMFSDMKAVLFGGERVDPESVRRILRKGPPGRLLHVYGPTETTTFATWHPVTEVTRDAFNIPIGGPIANSRIQVLDIASGPAATATVGELFLAGDGLSRGYLNDPRLTAQKFVPDPFAGLSAHTGDGPGGRLYRTGDLVKRLGSGAIEFHGRADTQVKVRGFRIELGEIEVALCDHEAVAEAVAVTREDSGGRRILAYVRTQGERSEPLEPGQLRAYLQERLPDYMVPSAISVLKRFPLTPNGKVDLRALPDPDSGTEKNNYQPPRNRAEKILTELWSEILEVGPVSIHDNFFELGGDSILGIQLISRANRMGLAITIKQLFQNQTVATLAECAGESAATNAEQGIVSGDVPLTPIQSWFLGAGRLRPQHFNIAVMLQPTEPLQAAFLARALQTLALHHDALRLRFTREGDDWRQRHADADGDHFVLEEIDLSAEAEPLKKLEAAADARQRQLDLERGPLARAILFDLGATSGQRLFIAIHHLVVDGISWRVLVEDLEMAYRQLTEGREPKLMPKSTSWKAWAERLAAHAQSDELLGELPFWREQASLPVAHIPVEHPDAPNTGATTQTVAVSLSESETESLLREVPAVYNTRINDVLMTALVMATGQTTGNYTVRIALEGHGREPLFDDVDFSRTVGWFTAMYPVVLGTGGPVPPGEALKTVKEQLRRVPNNGIGYGLLRHVNRETGPWPQEAPQLNFNYLGQSDVGGAQTGLFKFSGESMGREHAPEDVRGHLIEIVGMVHGGCLRLIWNYSGERLERETVSQLAERNMACLREIVNHCLSEGAGGRTPSDFPHLSLDQAELDRILERFPDLETIYPATPMQQGFLFHSLAAPDTSVYVEQLSMRLRGPLRADLFRKAWQRVASRHEAMRTLFEYAGGVPLQVVTRERPFPWHEVALGDRSVESALAADLESGFDPAREVATRVTLVSRGDEDTHLIWAFHHALMDGWSVPVVLQEVGAVYAALIEGIEPELPPVAQHAAYIRWLETRDAARCETFWREQLRGFDEPNRLLRGGGSLKGEEDYAKRQVHMSREESEELEAFARKSGLTVSTLIQAAWALLLGRYTGRHDVLFGVTLAGRPPELEGVAQMVGLFINTLPFRVFTGPGKKPVAWLKELQDLQAELLQFQDGSLAEIQRYSDVPVNEPLFETIVVFENYPVDSSVGAGWAGMEVSEVEIYERANYPVALQAAPGAEIGLRIGYDATGFSGAFIEGMLRHLRHLLRQLPSHGERDIASLEMLEADERRRVLETFNPEPTAEPRVSAIHEAFEAWAVRAPQAVALIHGEETTAYGALDASANRIAHAMLARGTGFRDAVGVCLEEDRPETFAALLAILKAGAAYVPLDPNLPSARLRDMVADAGVTMLVHRGGPPEFAEPVERFLDLAGDAGFIARQPAEKPAVARHRSAMAYIMFTSGSTGRPKAVAIPHRGPVSLVKESNFFTITPEEVLLQASVLSFDASTLETWGALLNGAALVLMRAADLQRIPELVARHRVTVLHLTTQLFHLMVETHLSAFSGIRMVLTGGEVLAPGHARRFRDAHPDIALYNCYGPTETTTLTAVHDTAADGEGPVPVGKPIARSRIFLLDRDGHPVPVGVRGEIHIAGPGLALGYLNRPDATALRFVPDPFNEEDRDGARLYATGDLGAFREDGSIRFLGRKDNQVKLRGFRIELGEIEHALLALAEIERAVVLARNLDGDLRLAAYVKASTKTEDPGSAAASVQERLRQWLPEYMIPASIVFLDDIPLKPSGKVDTHALPDPEGIARTVAFVAPGTEVERAIAEAWSAVLKIPEIGIHDNFFELGGHSLLVTRVAARLRESLNVALPVQAMFENPTVAALAEYIEVVLWAKPPGVEEASGPEEEGEI